MQPFLMGCLTLPSWLSVKPTIRCTRWECLRPQGLKMCLRMNVRYRIEYIMNNYNLHCFTEVVSGYKTFDKMLEKAYDYRGENVSGIYFWSVDCAVLQNTRSLCMTPRAESCAGTLLILTMLSPFQTTRPNTVRQLYQFENPFNPLS